MIKCLKDLRLLVKKELERQTGAKFKLDPFEFERSFNANYGIFRGRNETHKIAIVFQFSPFVRTIQQFFDEGFYISEEGVKQTVSDAIMNNMDVY